MIFHNFFLLSTWYKNNGKHIFLFLCIIPYYNKMSLKLLFFYNLGCFRHVEITIKIFLPRDAYFGTIRRKHGYHIFPHSRTHI